MVRAPFYDKGVKKGAWSKEEDERLRAYIQKHGHSNWRQLPKLAGLARCGKSCRLRWLNYLRPDLKHGNYTPKEEEIIIKLHQQFGNRWSAIAEKLPGRTDSEIKNYWHSYLKKLPKCNEITTCELKSPSLDNSSNLEENAIDQFVTPETSADSTVGDEFPYILESSTILSTETSSEGNNHYSPTSSFEESNIDYLSTKEDNFEELTTISSPSAKEDSFEELAISCPSTKEDNFDESAISCLGTKEDIFAPWVTIFEELSDDFWTEPFLSEETYTTNEMCSSKEMAFLTPGFYDGTNLF